MRRMATGLALAALAALASACATGRPVEVGQGVSGDGVARLAANGVIRMTVRTADPTGMTKDGVIEFRPGDPGYDVLFAEVEKNWPDKKKRPTFTWQIGTPVYGP